MRPFINQVPLLTALVLLAACTQAVACGEVLTRSGTAMRYHSFVSRHPADILVYAGRDHRPGASEDSGAFRENLERAGHRVTVVEDPDALAAAFSAHGYDVVIAFSGDIERINALVGRAAREPSLIPVLQHDAPDQREWRAKYPRLLTDNSNLNQFLKSIEQTMKERGA